MFLNKSFKFLKFEEIFEIRKIFTLPQYDKKLKQVTAVTYPNTFISILNKYKTCHI